MKEQVKDMFAEITMPEATERNIRRTMAKQVKGNGTAKKWGRGAAAIAAMLALILTISPAARAAVNNLVVKYFFPGSDITVYEQIDENGEKVSVTAVDTEAPAFARVVNGRLYFLGNHEKIDITEQITEEEPYYYSYVDDYGLTHAMAVGYSGTIENYGIYEFIWEETNGEKEWVTGTGRNFISSETESRYPWVDVVWEDLDIPWPKPE